MNESILKEKISKMNFEKTLEDIKHVLNPTHLIQSEYLSQKYSNNIYLKPECLQPTGSFKLRGVMNKLMKLTDEEKKRGIICASDGNHAIAVSFCARELNIKSTVVMSLCTPLFKLNAVKHYGSEIISYGLTVEDAYKKAHEIENEMNLVFVHECDDLDVIEGNATVGLEILNQLPNTDIIIVPVGGGSLVSGISLYCKKINPNIEVIGVEPSGANCLKCSIEEGCVQYLNNISTIAGSVAFKSPGNIPYQIAKDNIKRIVEISDLDIMEAFVVIMQYHRIVAENAACLSVSALKKLNVKDKNIVCVITGGNVDMISMVSIIDRGLIYMNRIFCFALDIPDYPGSLERVCHLIKSANGNIVNIKHNLLKAFNRGGGVALEFAIETTGKEHIKQITELLEKNGCNVMTIY